MSGPSHGRLLSAVVLNFNGGEMVMQCLKSVAAQDHTPLEVVVVDSASTDGSLQAVCEAYPQAKVVALKENRGYAGGMNAGIEACRGENLLLLNFDATLEEDYARRCVEALESDPRLGGVTGKLLKATRGDRPLIDTTGHIVFRNRRPVDRGEFEEDLGQYDDDTEVFGVCGAAPCYRREMLDDVRLGGEYFDEDFFAYFEDFDLSWRARLRGWRFGYVPGAVGYHHRGGSGGKASTFILACNHRNRILAMVKNDHPLSFLRHLPGILYAELRSALWMLGVRPAALFVAWGQLLRLLPKMWRKRKTIQRARQVGWRDLEEWFQPYDYRAVYRRLVSRKPS